MESQDRNTDILSVSILRGLLYRDQTRDYHFIVDLNFQPAYGFQLSRSPLSSLTPHQGLDGSASWGPAKQLWWSRPLPPPVLRKPVPKHNTTWHPEGWLLEPWQRGRSSPCCAPLSSQAAPRPFWGHLFDRQQVQTVWAGNTPSKALWPRTLAAMFPPEGTPERVTAYPQTLQGLSLTRDRTQTKRLLGVLLGTQCVQSRVRAFF